MRPPDFIDRDDADESANEELARKEVRCKHCLERGLYWQESRSRLHNCKIRRLVDEDGNRHRCNTSDDFEVLPKQEIEREGIELPDHLHKK